MGRKAGKVSVWLGFPPVYREKIIFDSPPSICYIPNLIFHPLAAACSKHQRLEPMAEQTLLTKLPDVRFNSHDRISTTEDDKSKR